MRSVCGRFPKVLKRADPVRPCRELRLGLRKPNDLAVSCVGRGSLPQKQEISPRELSGASEAAGERQGLGLTDVARSWMSSCRNASELSRSFPFSRSNRASLLGRSTKAGAIET